MDDEKKRIWTIFAVVAIVVILALAGLIYILFVNPMAASRLRDIAIILLALEAVVMMLLLVGTLIFLWWIILILKDEIVPILKSASETANTVRGTATFVSGNVVSPLIKASGYMAGISQALRVLIGFRSTRQ